MADTNTVKVNWLLDIGVLIAASIQVGVVWNKVDSLESRFAEMRAAQVTEARIVRIEEQQKYMLQRVEETNALLRQYLEQQQREAQGKPK